VIGLLCSRRHAPAGLLGHELNLGAQASAAAWVRTALWFLLPDDRPVPLPFERLLVGESGRLTPTGGIRAEANPADATIAEALREAAASALRRPS